MRKGDNGGEKKTGGNRDFFNGHEHRCQSTARTPTDWNADRSCQYNIEEQIIITQAIWSFLFQIGIRIFVFARSQNNEKWS